MLHNHLYECQQSPFHRRRRKTRLWHSCVVLVVVQKRIAYPLAQRERAWAQIRQFSEAEFAGLKLRGGQL
jgi:hypothetical protein